MRRKVLLIIGSLLFGLLSYNALAVIHYDVDLTSMIAYRLNISIQTVGYISGAVSLVFLILAIRAFRNA